MREVKGRRRQGKELTKPDLGSPSLGTDLFFVEEDTPSNQVFSYPIPFSPTLSGTDKEPTPGLFGRVCTIGTSVVGKTNPLRL